MRRKALRAGLMTAALAAFAPFASAYYYWTYFANSGGPFIPVRARFDLSSLQNNTIAYVISDQGPGPSLAGDSYQAVVSQIRAAAEVWNGVSSSSLRLAFGGVGPAPSGGASPEIDIVFDDNLPPGVIALTTPSIASNAGTLAAGGANFVPILHSQVQLRKDLTNSAVPSFPTASWDDNFFLTVVHELGHAIGLQHTETASAMSTYVTRATTKARPLTTDDVAGVSLLYPANGFQASTGSITGTVSLNGSGVNMAVVTALSTTGDAVSALANPDGSYRIDGVPPGQYYVYVHPLPPAQQGETYPDNVVPPQDPNGKQFAANTGFGGQFLGGGTDWTQTPLVNVGAGASSDGINFNVQRRSGPAAYNLVLYGFLGSKQTPVQAPPLQPGSRVAVAFYANSSLGNSGYLQPAPGLNVSAIGGAAQIESGSVIPYPNYAPYFEAIVDTNPSITSATRVALAVTLDNDLYVLPIAFKVAPGGMPSISSVDGATDGQGNATVTVAGSNLGTATRILFDGAPARSQTFNSDGSITASAPPAAGGYRAAVEALNADGQTSSQLLGSSQPAGFTFGGPAFPGIGVSLPSGNGTVAAGIDTMVEITGFNTNFVDGEMAVGFGSGDVLVRRIWVVSPGRLMLNISVNGAAAALAAPVSVVSGIELATQAGAFQIVPAAQGQMSLRTPILNHATHLAGIPAGGVAEINTSGLPSSLAGWTLTVANQLSNFSLGANGQILATIPVGLLPGPAIVRLTAPDGTTVPPVIVQVDAPAPLIVSALNVTGAALDKDHAAQSGDTITLVVAGLADTSGNLPAAGAIAVNFGGPDQTPLSIASSPLGALLQVPVPQNTPPGADQVSIRLDTRLSAPFTIFVR